jgi:hypothetical protein
MSLSQETVLELMALADGELQGEAKERAESLALRNEEARRLVEAMHATRVRAWLNDAVAEQTRPADAIADEVMARLDEGPRRWSQARGRRGSKVMLAQAIVASTLAIAAGVAICLRSDERRVAKAPVASLRVPPGEAPPQSVEVDEIDSTAHVSIFEISAAANPTMRSSVVVWIDDEGAER